MQKLHVIYVEKIDRINKLKSHECYLVHPLSGLTRRGGIDFRKKNTMSEAPIVNTQESSIDTEDNSAKGRFSKVNAEFDEFRHYATFSAKMGPHSRQMYCSSLFSILGIWLYLALH